jgi:hypothetical protein
MKKDLIYTHVQRHAVKRRKPGVVAKRRATAKRTAHKGDKTVYAAVDARDGCRCRLSGIWYGTLIHRHHIVKRRPGNTTVENVISLAPDTHLERIHGLRPDLKLVGNANIVRGVEVWELMHGCWARVKPNI